MAEYVSSHSKLPAALTLEYERVLSPCLLDGHNRYAGAEYVSGTEPQPRSTWTPRTLARTLTLTLTLTPNPNPNPNP